MNQEKFNTFCDTYRQCLLEAVQAAPQEYALTPSDTEATYAERVANKILQSIGGGKHFGVNYDSAGFKRTCKALGIKHTRKAILEYLEIT